MAKRWHQAFWALAQLLAGLVSFAAFFVYAPWLGTKPIEEAPAEATAALPQACPAFSVNHGTYICEWHDTVSRNPGGFALCAGIFLATFGFCVISSLAGRGLASIKWTFWRRESRDDG